MNALVVLATVVLIVLGWIVIRTRCYRATGVILCYVVFTALCAFGVSRVHQPPAVRVVALAGGAAGLIVISVILFRSRKEPSNTCG